MQWIHSELPTRRQRTQEGLSKKNQCSNFRVPNSVEPTAMQMQTKAASQKKISAATLGES
jgi:hypothetical protein